MNQSDRPELRLHEQIMLLALRDEKGTLEFRAGMYPYALGGAILSELVLEGCIAIDEKSKGRVDVVERKPGEWVVTRIEARK